MSGSQKQKTRSNPTLGLIKMADSQSSNEIQIVSDRKRQKVITSSDSKSDDGKANLSANSRS